MAKIHAMELRTKSRLRPAQKSRGQPSRIDDDLVRRFMKQRPDIVLRELRQQLLESGTASASRIWRVC